MSTKQNNVLICKFCMSNIDLATSHSIQYSKHLPTKPFKEMSIKQYDYYLETYSALQKNSFFGHSLCKWGHFERAKPTLKMLLASWFLVCFFKRFRSFIALNLGSTNQRAANIMTSLWFPSGAGQILAFKIQQKFTLFNAEHFHHFSRSNNNDTLLPNVCFKFHNFG